jgi:hypothetical protein
VLVAGSAALFRRGRAGGTPFLAGFILAGTVAIPVVQIAVAMLPLGWFIPLARAINTQAARLHSSLGPDVPMQGFLDASFVAAFGLMTFVPELLIALTGGLLARARSRRHP